MHRGSSLIELLIVLAILGTMSGMAIPRFSAYRDRIATDAAAASTVALLSTARHAAVRRSGLTAVRFDRAAARVIVYSGADTLAMRPLGEVHGVTISTSRDSIAFAPSGMGFGAANTTVVFRRGAAADTVTVSRLGRVRR